MSSVEWHGTENDFIDKTELLKNYCNFILFIMKVNIYIIHS